MSGKPEGELAARGSLSSALAGLALALVLADLLAARLVFGVEAWMVAARLAPLLALLVVQTLTSISAAILAFRADRTLLGLGLALTALAGLVAAALVAGVLWLAGAGTPPMSV